MSRTTTVDTVPAGEVSVAGASRPDPFKRGTRSLCASLSRCSPPVWPPLPCSTVQPILPVLSNEFGVSPASSSISLSISTAMLAVGLLFTGPLSDARPQAGDGHRPAAGRLLFTVVDYDDQLARHPDYARAHRPVAERRSGGRHDLSEREIHPSFVAFSMDSISAATPSAA